MSEFYVSVGDATSFSKTVGEFDVYGFAGITGDFAPNHVNKAYMEKSGYGRLIAHGALLVGYMSTASTQMAMHSRADTSVTGVSLGYDRMRFLAPVYFGDTITVDYRIVAIDPDEAARDRRHQDHQPGRHAGRGGAASVEVGEELIARHCRRRILHCHARESGHPVNTARSVITGSPLSRGRQSRPTPASPQTRRCACSCR